MCNWHQRLSQSLHKYIYNSKRGFLKQQNKEEEEARCNAQKIERLCEMTASFFFTFAVCTPLCKKKICTEEKASPRSPKCLERPSCFLSFLEERSAFGFRNPSQLQSMFWDRIRNMDECAWPCCLGGAVCMCKEEKWKSNIYYCCQCDGGYKFCFD